MAARYLFSTDEKKSTALSFKFLFCCRSNWIHCQYNSRYLYCKL